MTKDYYAIIGVEQDASYDDIKKAWRDKARQWHPDMFQTADEKAAAHKKFVDIVEAYAVLIDIKQRASYDRRMANDVADIYEGYENANPAQDQQEASDWFQSILDESPSEFWGTTLLIVVLCPVTIIIWIGLLGIVYVFYQVVTGQSELGWGGVVMLIFMFFANLLVAFVGAHAFKDLYYRIKRIMMWISIRSQIKRRFPAQYKKRGTAVAVWSKRR